MRKAKQRMMIIISLLIFIMTGCGAEGTQDAGLGAAENSGPKNNPENNTEFPSDETSVSWQADYFRLENRYDLTLSTDCNIFGCYIEAGKVLLDNIEKENFSVKETFILSDASLIEGMAADREGNVYLLENRENSSGFWKVDADGSLQDYVKMDLEDTEDAEDMYLKGIYSDQSGYFYVWCEMIVPEMEMLEGYDTEVWHGEDRV